MKKLPVMVVVGAAAAGLIGLVAWRTWPAPWPDDRADVVVPALELDSASDVKRVYLDAGHGAEGNIGNVGALDQREQDFTLALANDVAVVLRASGRFEVKVCRTEGELVAYADRVNAANAWPADVFVSLHSDVRDPEGVGYSVLWSDEGNEALTKRRVALARSMARNLAALALPAYGGDEYVGLYEGDPVPGVFVDRHDPGQRIFVLRKPEMPSIIVETHNAKSAQEARRWDEPAVRLAFARAVALALNGD